jgi:hypothetical protein
LPNGPISARLGWKNARKKVTFVNQKNAYWANRLQCSELWKTFFEKKVVKSGKVCFIPLTLKPKTNKTRFL